MAGEPLSPPEHISSAGASLRPPDNSGQIKYCFEKAKNQEMIEIN